MNVGDAAAAAFALEARPVASALEQRIRYDYSGPVANLRQRLLVVPPETHGGQRRIRWSLTVDGASPAAARGRADSFGNLVIRVSVPRVESWVEFAAATEVETAPEGAVHRIPPDRRYVSFTRLTAPDPHLAALAAAAVPPGRPPDPASISRHVHAALTYEYGVTGVRTTAAEALRHRRGVCQDFAHVMLAVCRLAGLPARYASGHLLGEGGSHAWVEVLRPDPHHPNLWAVEGWDPTHDRRTGPGHLTVAVGRDYADVAPMSGTYDGDGVVGTLTVRKRAAVS